MSHTIKPSPRLRLQRSELAVPGSNPEMIGKAVNSDADYIFLDIEDAVAPPDKERARANIVAALNEIDWRGRRQDHFGTHQRAGHALHVPRRRRPDGAGRGPDRHPLVPKVGVPADLYMVEAMVNQIEIAKGYKDPRRPRGADPRPRSAWPMSNPSHPSGGRLEALHFGVADYAASLKARTVNIGGLNPDYPGDQWHFGLSRMTVACRAYGLRAIDGPFGDFSDPTATSGCAPCRSPRHRRQVGDPFRARSRSPTISSLHRKGGRPRRRALLRR